MATVWTGDTFRIFPGKYGEDPLWGEAHDLKFASGKTVDEVFHTPATAFSFPALPSNALPGSRGLHGAIWFEALYQEAKDASGKTLYALYHNENYPATLPRDPTTGEGYADINWPQGLRGEKTKTAVCRIGLMKSADGGHSWEDKGILMQDLQPRMILRPHNTGINFAGGVGDPSAVACGDFLYIFYGEYGYPGKYDSAGYDAVREWRGQCISMARLPLAALDEPAGKTRRWNGIRFAALPDSAGAPIPSLQIPRADGGGPASSPTAKYYWGPSVSWNNFLHCWVMLMAKAEGASWSGNSIYISFNHHADLGAGKNADDWSLPELLLKKPGHKLWYPSLQPVDNLEEKQQKYTSVNLGEQARLFIKDMQPGSDVYQSEYLVRFHH